MAGLPFFFFARAGNPDTFSTPKIAVEVPCGVFLLCRVFHPFPDLRVLPRSISPCRLSFPFPRTHSASYLVRVFFFPFGPSYPLRLSGPLTPALFFFFLNQIMPFLPLFLSSFAVDHSSCWWRAGDFVLFLFFPSPALFFFED